MIRGERHLHGRCSRSPSQDGIRLERAPGVDHLVAGPDDAADDLRDGFHRTRAEDDAIHRHLEPVRGDTSQVRDGGVGVTVHHRRLERDGLAHRRQRRIGRLIRRQLEPRRSPLSRRTARLVAGDGCQVCSYPNCHRRASTRWLSRRSTIDSTGRAGREWSRCNGSARRRSPRTADPSVAAE